MDRKQPIVIGTNKKGELIWGFVPMAYWQMAMFPLRYLGDFAAHWQRVQMFLEHGIESDDGISADFKSYVPSEFANKYERKHHKGD